MKKRKIIIILLFVFIILCVVCILGYGYIYKKNDISNKEETLEEISYHYGNFVKTNKKSKLYDNNYNEVGLVEENVELTLEKLEISKETKYFKISYLDDEYYINYQDVDKIEKLSSFDDRYKNYIVFNENIITTNKTSFYDENDNLIYEFNKSFDLPIIIKENNSYGVEYNNRLVYVKKDDIKEIKKNINTEKQNSSGIAVLNYHAFYDENDSKAKSECNTEICHSKSQFKSQLELIKSKGMLTLKMKEVEMYVDGKIQLPKSVLITIDDGGRAKDGIDLLTEYKMYATIFLVTSWFDPKDYYKTEYIELHSHSDHLHETGVCSKGQGGGIQCLDEDAIQKDLKLTREKLNNTTYFCYPFYEYNDYSIEMLKKAGFTMAFIGESSKEDNLVHIGDDKFRLRRFVIVTYTTIDGLNKYFDQIKV